MPSSAVIRRQKAAQVLRSAIQTHQKVAADSLTEKLTPFLDEGETLTDLETFQTLLLRLVTRHEEEMVDADEAHDSEVKEDREPRRRRDRLARDLGQQLRQCRLDALGAFGTDAATDFLKVDGRIRDNDAEALLRQVRQAIGILRNTNLTAPQGVMESSSFDRAGWADMLEPPMNALQAAVNVVAGEVREDKQTREARNAAIEQMNATLQTVSRLMQYIYRLGGHEDFESGLVPILPQRSRRSTQSDETAPTGEESGSAGPGATPNLPAAAGGGSPSNPAAT